MEGAGGSAEAVPLPYVSAATLQLVLSYYRAADDDAGARIGGGWDMPQLCDVLLAADYLALERLLSYACGRVASSIQACEDLPAFRQLFGIAGDLSGADEEYAQKERRWILRRRTGKPEPAAHAPGPITSAPVDPSVVADVLYRLATSGYEEAAARCVYLCAATASHEGLCAAVSHAHMGDYKCTHLMAACEVGDTARVEWWVKHGADVNATFPSGETTLHRACVNEQESLALRLIELGADVNAKSRNGDPLLVAACENALKLLVLRLLELGTDVNTKGPGDYTALHSACLEGHEGVVLLLLHHGADVNSKATDGFTPLHSACFRGHESMVLLLLGAASA